MKHSTAPRRTGPSPIPPLEPGQRLKQPEFHRRYEQYPDHVKFELVGGIVYMASPLRRPDGNCEPELSGTLWLYKARTPGLEILANATTILGEEGEPQPDLSLRILPEYGGQSRTTADQYVEGAPELLAEVSHSTRVLDLTHKRKDYERAGVQEYLVVSLEDEKLFWFDFSSKKELKPTRQGIYRSRVFPGLWIDGKALLARDAARLIEVVQQGLASKEHAAFVKRLERARKKHGSA